MNSNPNADSNAALPLPPKPEETLRLLARMPPPAELTNRVHARIHARIAEAGHKTQARRGFWSQWLPAQRLQFAAAAVFAVAVGGTTWSFYHRPPVARPQPIAPASPGPAGSAFGSANATRVPPTLHPIQVPPSPHRKPGSGHAVKAAPKPAAATPAVSPAPAPPNR